MLVLSRKPLQEIVITVPPSTESTTITVSLIDCDKTRGRLGFVARKDVSIHRKEVQLQKDQERLHG